MVFYWAVVGVILKNGVTHRSNKKDKICGRAMRERGKSRIVYLTVAFLVGLIGGPDTISATSPKDILIVANSNAAKEKITLDDVRDFFLKKRLRWYKSGKAVPVNAPESTELRKVFRRRLLNMNDAEEARYWHERKIKEGVVPPPIFRNNLKAVFHLKGSISYVYREDFKEGVSKLLLVLPSDETDHSDP
jgi:hypothetical protein